MKKITVAVMAALISGCVTTPQQQPLPVEVKMPVAVSCIKPEEIPTKPDYESLKDNDNTPDGTVILHITRDFAKSLPYQEQMESVILSCHT